MSTTCSRIDKLPTAGTEKLTNAGGGGGGGGGDRHARNWLIDYGKLSD